MKRKRIQFWARIVKSGKNLANWKNLRLIYTPTKEEGEEIEESYQAYKDSVLAPWFKSRGIEYDGDENVAFNLLRAIEPDVFEWTANESESETSETEEDIVCET